MQIPEELRSTLAPNQLAELSTAIRNVESHEGDPAEHLPRWIRLFFPHLDDITRGIAIVQEMERHDNLRREIK